MKYVYVKNRNTLDVAKHEVINEDEYVFTIKVGDELIYINRQLNSFSSVLDSHFILIPYKEYMVIVNGKIQAQREILDQEYSRYQKAYYEAMKELRAKELPIDEVTE